MSEFQILKMALKVERMNLKIKKMYLKESEKCPFLNDSTLSFFKPSGNSDLYN